MGEDDRHLPGDVLEDLALDVGVLLVDLRDQCIHARPVAAGQPGQRQSQGENVLQVHLQRIVGLLTDFKGRGRCDRGQQKINLFESIEKILT